jgi:hypothetical protein
MDMCLYEDNIADTVARDTMGKDNAFSGDFVPTDLGYWDVSVTCITMKKKIS